MNSEIYRGYRLESSSVGTDIYFRPLGSARWDLIEVKVPLDIAKSTIDNWLTAK